MNCWRLQQVASAFADGDLDPKDAREATAHIEACRPCRTLVERVAAVPDLREPEVPREPCDRLMEALEGSILARCAASAPGRLASSEPRLRAVSAWRSRELRVPVPAALAAAAAVALLVGLQAWTWRRVERLETAQRTRESAMRTLEAELASARAGWIPAQALAPSANGAWTTNSVDALGLPVRGNPWRSAGELATGTDGAAFELVSAGGPRVVR